MSNIIDSIQLSGTVYTLSAQTEGGGVPESTFTAYTATTDERISQDEEVTAAGLNALNSKITPTVELTQAQYDALVTAGTVAEDTYYIISDAQAVDLTNYYTKSETNTLLGGKQATLVSGTNIKTINNESILGSGNINIQGGSTYTAGRGIDITNDTISFNLPISAGTGTNSVKENTASNIANGTASHAEGSSTQASGYYSHAEGTNTKASGISSHAEGTDTTASGNYSHAEGQNTKASGISSHAEGYQTSAVTNYSHAEGRSTTASGQSSHAEGYGAQANGNYSHAEGQNTTTNGSHSHAEGRNTTASGHYSHAEGFGTETKNQSEHASGQYNNSVSGSSTFGDSGNTLFSVGNGTAVDARHNAFEIRQNGDIYLTKNGQNVKLQDKLGGGTVDQTIISGSTNAVAGGAVYDKFDEVEQVAAAALNNINDRLSEDEEVTAAALNNLNDAIQEKQDQLSAGTNITISGNVISATGGGGGKAIEAGRGIAITTGETADTVSFNLPISAGTGDNSVVFGISCQARGSKSFAGGQGSSGLSEGSFAFGQNCKAGQWGIAVGNGVTASNIRGAAAFGQYNVVVGNMYSAASAITIFSVGNGDFGANHNAFEIRQNGDIYCSDGTNDVKLQDTITATAANTTALGGLSLVKLTQSAYDALSPNYDSNTLYVIVN